MKSVALFVAALLSGFLIACGGSDSGPDASGETTVMTMDEAIEQGDELCVEQSGRIPGLTADYQQMLDDSDFESAADVIDSLAEVTGERSAAFSDMEVSDEDALVLGEYSASLDESSALMGELGDALRNVKPQALVAATRDLAIANKQTAELSQEMGFQQCGSGMITEG